MSPREMFQARWAELAPRERQMVALAVALVALALLWWVALAPALRTLSAAREEHARLDAQLQQMSTLQTQAKALQAQPRANRDDSMRALENSVRQGLGPNAQFARAGDGANVAMRAAPADGLAQWLAQARSNARALPREAHLTRSQAAPPAASSNSKAADEPARVRWDGTLVMALPAAR
ncbi:MAG: type II secretion system protein GspM [Variovorax sp.]